MKIFCVCLVCLITLSFSAEKNYGNKKVSRVVSVYDGDTFDADIDSWPTIIGKSVSIRVNGIDCAEMKGSDSLSKIKAVAAKSLAKSLLNSGKTVTLKNMMRDKYFRIDADVYIGTTNLADTLLKLGLAKPYTGGTKDDWINGQ